MNKIGVLGAGTWGMALARMLCISGNEVTVWSALPREVEEFSATRRHPNLPEMEIPQEIRFVKDIREACEKKDILLFAVPSPFVRSTARLAAPYVEDGQIIVDVAKGIEAETLLKDAKVLGTDELVGKHIKDAMKNVEFDRVLHQGKIITNAGVKIGDTYIASSAFTITNLDDSTVLVHAGDLIIANGEEDGETGYIKADTLVWQVVDTGYIDSHENTLEVDAENKGINLVSHLGEAISRVGIESSSNNIEIGYDADYHKISVGMVWDTF